MKKLSLLVLFSIVFTDIQAMRKRPTPDFSPQEDAITIQLYVQGYSWNEIAVSLPPREDIERRDSESVCWRWKNFISPSAMRRSGTTEKYRQRLKPFLPEDIYEMMFASNVNDLVNEQRIIAIHRRCGHYSSEMSTEQSGLRMPVLVPQMQNYQRTQLSFFPFTQDHVTRAIEAGDPNDPTDIAHYLNRH